MALNGTAASIRASCPVGGPPTTGSTSPSWAGPRSPGSLPRPPSWAGRPSGAGLVREHEHRPAVDGEAAGRVARRSLANRSLSHARNERGLRRHHPCGLPTPTGISAPCGPTSGYDPGKRCGVGSRHTRKVKRGPMRTVLCQPQSKGTMMMITNDPLPGPGSTTT
jgi:hypothetical protein